MMGMNANMMRASAKPAALRQVQLELALTAVAEAEKIEISEEDCEKEIANLADQYKLSVDQVKATISTDMLKRDLRLQKASELVIAEAKVGEAPEKKEEEAPAEKPKRTRKKKADETADQAE